MAPPWQQLHCSLCINFYWVCCTAYLLRPSSGAPQSRYAGLLFLVDAGARRSNSAKFSTEQTLSQTPKQQHNIWLIFKIKQCVLMPAQKSQKKKEAFTSTATDPSVKNTSCCFLFYFWHIGDVKHDVCVVLCNASHRLVGSGNWVNRQFLAGTPRLDSPTEPQTAPDVPVSTLHGHHHYQCMNVCMNYCQSLLTKASAKCPKM